MKYQEVPIACVNVGPPLCLFIPPIRTVVGIMVRKVACQSMSVTAVIQNKVYQ